MASVDLGGLGGSFREYAESTANADLEATIVDREFQRAGAPRDHPAPLIPGYLQEIRVPSRVAGAASAIISGKL